jgi:cytochrome c2
MLHVVLLPGIVTAVVIAHIVLARRHGTTPVRSGAAVPRWPRQGLYDVAAMAIVFVVLLAFVANQHGADLAAPADPTSRYDARPLWYFRWLYALRTIAGSFEQLAAMAAPAVVGGFLVALPVLDSGPDRSVKARRLWLGALAGMLAMIGGLTVMSFANDAGDDKYVEARDKQAEIAQRARALARTNGVPVTGPGDLWKTAPMWLGRTLFAKACANCHDEASKDRIGPIIGPGHGDRAWLIAFLNAPSDDRFWGKTKLAKTEAAMKPVELPPDKIAEVAELLYAQSGATDVDTKKRDAGVELAKGCGDCHSLDEGVAGTSAPNLAGLGSRDYYFSFISNPKSPIHMGSDNEMPRFDKELTVVERDAIAEYLVWLRTATKSDLDALGSL